MTEINSNQEQPKIEQFIDWEDRYKRLAAEIENTKKRLARNSSQTIEQMLDRLLLDMLPFADNLERILSNQGGDDRCSQLVDGVRLTFRDFQNTLKRYGVKPLEALNQPFDPAFHEATAVVEDPSQPGGTVIEVIQTGYLREDRLLRPAQVIVSTD
jgi:molecular chaperone GrpE